jgi:hypothetical protein
MNWYQKYKQLKPTGRKMLLTVLFSLPLVHLNIHLFGLNNTQSILAVFRRRVPKQPPADTRLRLMRARHIFRYTRLHGPFKGNCLSRSLLMQMLLQNQGICSQMIIGVRFDDQQFKAHAWLERDGEPLNERSDVRQRFSVMESNRLPKETQFI